MAPELPVSLHSGENCENFIKTSTPLSLHVNVDLVENLVIYDELCSQMHFNFNIPGDLYEKHTANLYQIMKFKFSSMIFHEHILKNQLF